MAHPQYIEITETRHGSTFVVRLATPLSFGRKPEGRNRVTLDRDDRTISHQHGLIDEGPDGLFFRDKSSNGSYVDGRFVHNATVKLADAFEIRIRNYRIRRVTAKPLLIAFVSTLPGRPPDELILRENVELLPGNYVALLPPQRSHRLAVTQATMEPLPSALANFIRREEAVYLSRARDVTARVNKSENTQSRIQVKAGDVAFIGDDRIEILSPEMNRIVCGHTTCRLLNPPQIHALCKWCGHDLANVNSVSRILIPT